jgi:hypothetical protein
VSGISAGKALGYATLPGLWPRVKSLFFSGFGTLAYFIALTYMMVRLLPPAHPYLDPRNIGQYGIRHVIAASLHELKFSWKNFDQIIIFFALMAGSAALLMYILGTAVFLLVSPVSAAWFVTPSPSTDVAFIMLDRIFGIGGIFGSEVTTNISKYGAFPNNFQIALQSLFQFFSMGLFLLSVLVFLYYIVTIIFETSMTGTPFGRRFDNIWIPIRIIAALGLLMPFIGGLNAAQYIVLYAAKYGSGLATNAWIVYNLRAGNNPVGMITKDVIARPSIPDYSKLIKDLLVIRGCMEMYIWDPEGYFDSKPGVLEWLVKGTAATTLLPATAGPAGIPPRSAFTSYALTYENYNTTFLDALNFYEGGDIRIVIGAHDPLRYKEYLGEVFPYCGEVVIPIAGHTREALLTAEAYMAAVSRVLFSAPRDGAPAGTLDAYEQAIPIATAKDYYDTSPGFRKFAYGFWPTIPNKHCIWDSDNDNINEYPRGGGSMNLNVLGDCRAAVPPIYWVNVIKRYQEAFSWAPLTGYDYLTEAIAGEDMNFSPGDVGWSTFGDPDPMELDFDTIRLGWGGAGIWFNKIAEKNGSLISAVGAAPYVTRYPNVMEKIKEQRLKTDKVVEQTGCEAYNPNKAGKTAVAIPDGHNQFSAEAAVALFALCRNLFENEQIEPVVDDGTGTLVPKSRSTKQPNPILNVINSLFGAGSLFNLLDNRTVHPMAMLSSIGRMLIDKAVFNMMAATGTSVIGGLNQMALGKGDPGFAYITIAASQFSKAFISFGLIALVAGILLFYVMPLLPFMYFFFAVGRWIKTIFEAMVGVPLWALAHLNMKGPGLPGTAASSGYFLILEIGIRPILTVFSLIAAFSVFSALIIVLNTIFVFATANIFGADMFTLTGGTAPSFSNMRGIVDQFIITIVYVIIVYMIGTSCFKLIDIIPDNIMRWSGAGVRTWGGSDNADDLVDRSSQMVAIPAYVLFNQLGQGVTGLSDVAVKEAELVIKTAKAKKKPSMAEQETNKLRQPQQEEAQKALQQKQLQQQREKEMERLRQQQQQQGTPQPGAPGATPAQPSGTPKGQGGQGVQGTQPPGTPGAERPKGQGGMNPPPKPPRGNG